MSNSAELTQQEINKMAADAFERIRDQEGNRISSLEVQQQGLKTQINDLEHLSQQLNDGRNALADSEAQQRAVAGMKTLFENQLSSVNTQLDTSHNTRDAAQAQLDYLKQKGVEQEAVKTQEGPGEVKPSLGNEEPIQLQSEMLTDMPRDFGELADSAEEVETEKEVSKETLEHIAGAGHSGGPSGNTERAHSGMVVQGDGRFYTNPPGTHPDGHSPDITVPLAFVTGLALGKAAQLKEEYGDKIATAAGEFKDKIVTAAEEAKDKVVSAAEQFKEQHFAVPEPKVELHDLPKEQAAAAALTNSDKFAAMSMNEKTAGLKTFFEDQNAQYEQSFDSLSSQARGMLQQAHGNIPSKELFADRDRLDAQIMEMREAAKQQSAQFRGELVETVVKEQAAKEEKSKIDQQIQAYDKRLQDMNKEAPPDVRNNFITNVTATGEKNAAERTADVQQKQFPEYPPPPKQEMSGPGSGGPGSGGPGDGGR